MNIFVKRRECQMSTYYHIETKHGPRQGLNLALHKIKLSRMKNVGAASYKKWLNWPDLPYSSDVDGKQICEKILNCKMLVSSRAT